EQYLEDTPSLSQTEYNVSTYLDFAKATGATIVSNLVNLTTGEIYHSGTHDWELLFLTPSMSDYYWGIEGLARLYDLSAQEGTPNETLSVIVSRAATAMVGNLLDPLYPGFYVNLYASPEAYMTKRAGIQAYAYEALRIAERVNTSLDFTDEKQSAIDCIAETLYDPLYGGLYFFTLQNGSLDVPEYLHEVYPNDGKRVDHLSLGTIALYDAGVETGNSTYTAMANSSLHFMIQNMPASFQGELYGMKLAVNRSGHPVETYPELRPDETVVTDPNAMAIRALLKGYAVTGDSQFLDWAKRIRDALLEHAWDTADGGFFTETLNGTPYDPLDDEDVKFYKLSEIQFQMLLSLEDFYELTDDFFSIQLVFDVLEIVITKLWDHEDGGWVRNGDQSFAVLTEEWEEHYTVVQGLAMIALERIWAYGLPILSYVRIGPTNPRSFDPIRFFCSAQDEDGIDTVYVNATASVNDTESSIILELNPSPEVGGIYNNTLDPLPDGMSVNFVIVANDTLGHVFVAGKYHFLVRDDVWPPVVLMNEIYPLGGPRTGDNVIIEFETYEFPVHSEMVSFQIFWKANDGTYAPRNMTLTGFDGDYWVWQVALGQFVAGDVLTYYAIASDESGNDGVSPFYRLTILGPQTNVTPIISWQMVAAIGLVSAPGIGYAFARYRRREALDEQRELKKEARKRARRGRSRRRR
ncbi:MAG: hypothetical protein ACW992_08475, partial [Candidatus Thorarchaeota archaeon]